MSFQDSEMTDTTPHVAAQPSIPEKELEKTLPAMSAVVEALPDIEASHTHPLAQATSKAVEEPCDGLSSGSEGEGERDIKRVKLDGEGAVVQEEKTPQEEEITFDLRMTWAGQGYDFRVQGSDRLYDFKVSLSSRR